MNKIWKALIVSSLVLSISALCVTHPRELGIDYLGWIVGVLALLTTVLLGWNIYTMIDFDKKKETIDRQHSKMVDAMKASQKYHNTLKAFTEKTIADVYQTTLVDHDKNIMFYEYLNHSVTALTFYSLIKSEDNFYRTLDEIHAFLGKNKEAYCLSRHNKMRILNTLGKIEDYSDSQSFCQLLQEIDGLQENKS